MVFIFHVLIDITTNEVNHNSKKDLSEHLNHIIESGLTDTGRDRNWEIIEEQSNTNNIYIKKSS